MSTFFPARVVLDVGGVWTRVGIVGEPSLRCIVRTAGALCRVMGTSYDESRVTHEVAAQVNQLVLFVPELCLSGCHVTLLVNASVNPVFAQSCRTVLEQHYGCTMGMLNTQLAALLSFGANTGMVLDVGYFSSRAVAVLGGVVAVDSIAVAPVGYCHVLQRLREQVARNCPEEYRHWPSDSSVLSADALHAHMNAFGAVSPTSDDAGRETVLAIKSLTVSVNVRDVLEFLFHHGDDDQVSLPGLVMRCFHQCHAQLLRPAMKSLHLIGGCAVFPNFTTRMSRELLALGCAKDLVVCDKLSLASSITSAVVGGMTGQP